MVLKLYNVRIIFCHYNIRFTENPWPGSHYSCRRHRVVVIYSWRRLKNGGENAHLDFWPISWSTKPYRLGIIINSRNYEVV